MEKWLIAGYVYIALMAVILGFFKLVLASRPTEVRGGIFDQVQIRRKGEVQPLLSTIVSTVVTVVLMAVGLVGMTLLIVHFAIVVQVILAVLVATATWGVLDIWGFALWAERKLDLRTAAYVIQIVVSLIVGVGWWIAPSWLTVDVAALILAFSVAHNLGVMKLRAMLIGLSVLILFDVWGVSISGFTAQLASAALASKSVLPMLFMVPANPLAWNVNYYGALGIGDIIFGAVMVVGFARYGLAAWASAGYALAILIAFLLPVSVLPALVTIVPCVFAAVGIGYLVQRRRKTRRPTADITMTDMVD